MSLLPPFLASHEITAPPSDEEIATPLEPPLNIPSADCVCACFVERPNCLGILTKLLPVISHDVMSLDNSIFDKGSVRLLLHCEDRTQNQGCFKAYSPYEIAVLRNNMLKTTFKNFVYSNVKPAFRGNFLNLSPERSKELDSISTKGKIDIIKK